MSPLGNPGSQPSAPGRQVSGGSDRGSAPLDRQQTESTLGDLLADKKAGPERFKLAYETAVQLVEEILDSPREEHVARATAVAGIFAAGFLKQAGLVDSLLLHRATEYRAAGHMVNVCLGALKLAQGLDVAGADWPALALGALLHDAGAMGVPEMVLAKEGRVSEAEWQFIVSHPTRGADWLEQSGRLPPIVAQMARQHHEQLDGQGFPHGLTSEAIAPWSRLCAVVDTYDLLTTARPFRDALQPVEALAVMDAESRKRFDPQMLAVWRGLMAGPNDKAASQTPGKVEKGPPRSPVASGQAGKPSIQRKTSPLFLLPLDSYLPLPPLAVPAATVDRRRNHRGGQDRRSHPRYRLNASCRVRFLESVQTRHISFWVNAVDISCGGMQFVHNRPLCAGELISVFIPAAGNAGKTLTARVARCRLGDDRLYYIGVRFEYRG